MQLNSARSPSRLGDVARDPARDPAREPIRGVLGVVCCGSVAWL